jgi:hypothetical protein
MEANPSTVMDVHLDPNQSIGAFIKFKFINILLIIPLYEENINEKIKPTIAVLIIAGKNRATLKNAIPFIALFRRTAKNNASGISIANFPPDKINVFKIESQKSLSLVNTLTKLSHPI